MRFRTLDVTQFTTFDRRDFLKSLGFATTLFASDSLLAGKVWANPLFSHYPFALGVASGDPAQDGFVIWTKLAPEPLAPNGGMPMKAVEVEWMVAEDAGFKSIAAKGTALARPELGHAVHVEISGLKDGRDYFYRFIAGRERSVVGRARTFPAQGAMAANVRFALAGCQRYEDGHFTAWREIARERFDFIYHYGDYIYEYRALRPGERAVPIVRDMPGNPDEIYHLADYRHRYALYKLDPDLQAAHASAPFLPSFDDHEIDNNWAATVSEEDGIPADVFALRRMAGFQAWYEHMPVRRAARPNGPDMLAYRRLAYGDLMQVDVLDTRQYRSDQPCNDGWKVCPAARDAERTMLGATQENWLSEGFKASKARWNVLAQQVPMARLDRNPDPAILETAMDKWDGAEAARHRLLKSMVEAGIANPVILAGDVHHHRASELKLDYDDASAPAMGVEFVATSITSEGDGTANWEAAPQLMAINPHLKVMNAQRGYIAHTVTPDTWKADFKVLDKVSDRHGALSIASSLTVENGKPALQRS